MRVLVTGSAGFVGTHVCRALEARGDEVVRVDRAGFAPVDAARLDVLWGLPRIDAIVHLASRCSTPGSVTDPYGTFSDTVATAAAVLELAREQHVPVLVTSSVKARDGQTPYGAAKRMVETWAAEYRSAYGLPVIVNRPGTIYGPGQEGSAESGWIAWFLRARDEGLPVVINGSGAQVRDLLHVDDYVRLLLLQLDDPDRYAAAVPWEVGGGPDNLVTVRGMAERLGLRYTFGPRRYGDADWYEGDNRVPGWEPRIRWYDTGLFRPAVAA